MCGIFGYVGKGDARKNIINGLKRLEYRGYDSWGVAVAVDNKIGVCKQIGSIGNFDDIGHTRWATHGGVSETNAHPHFASDKSFILAQNGIVENYQELKKELIKDGFKFETQTDTEVIVRLIEKKRRNKSYDLKEAVRKAFLDLKGRNTIILLEQSGKHMIAVKNGSPLVLGLGDEEVFIASDALSFADK
jgi:glucosamine--fructose-6-phosphate aminotransferase (isomerizing)